MVQYLFFIFVYTELAGVQVQFRWAAKNKSAILERLALIVLLVTQFLLSPKF